MVVTVPTWGLVRHDFFSISGAGTKGNLDSSAAATAEDKPTY
jgi:hypothetical protein